MPSTSETAKCPSYIHTLTYPTPFPTTSTTVTTTPPIDSVGTHVSSTMDLSALILVVFPLPAEDAPPNQILPLFPLPTPPSPSL